MKTQIIRQADE